MRKWLLGAVVALVLPAAALAHASAPSPTDLAVKACKTEKSEMGTKTFKRTYGAVKSAATAKKACLAKAGIVAETELKNAAQECKAERDAGVDAFNELYGTNENNRNAYGKCVSGKAKAATKEESEDRVSAADTCKTVKTDDAAGFKTAYGEKKNAFGKCVSATAKELGESDDTDA